MPYQTDNFHIAAMGFEVGRFKGDVDEELLCPICSGVLEDPVQVMAISIPVTINPNWFFSKSHIL